MSDIALPGEAVTRSFEIRALSRDRGGMVRAAALTANARLEDAAHALDAGFDMHIAKPVGPTSSLASWLAWRSEGTCRVAGEIGV